MSSPWTPTASASRASPTSQCLPPTAASPASQKAEPPGYRPQGSSPSHRSASRVRALRRPAPVAPVPPAAPASGTETRASRSVTRDLPGLAPAGAPPHPQGGEDKRAEQHDNADEQQIQQALGDN